MDIKLRKIAILEEENNSKGDLFTKLMAELFPFLGYEVLATNVHKGDREIDLEAKHCEEERYAIGECKAEAKNLDDQPIIKFVSTFIKEKDETKRDIQGYFFSITDFKKIATTVATSYGIFLVGPKKICQNLIESNILVSQTVAVASLSDLTKGVVLYNQYADLLAYENGWVWAFYYSNSNGQKATHVAFVDATGRPLIEELANKIVEIDRGINNIFRNLTLINKDKPRDLKKYPEWLKPIDDELDFHFERDFPLATKNNIEQGWIYQDENKIHEIMGHLVHTSKNICLIQAAEGRGKTYLSRIVAYNFFKQNHNVYFTDLIGDNDFSVSKFDTLLKQWGNNQKEKYLLVLENVHAFFDLKNLTETINKWLHTKNCNNLSFLLNARYTSEDDRFFDSWSRDFTVKLAPTENHVKEILSLHEKVVNKELNTHSPSILQCDCEQFITDKILFPKDKDNLKEDSANLRLLYRYLAIWRERKISIIEIEESEIIEEFGCKFEIDNLKPSEQETILYFSCIVQLGTPFYINKKKYENDYILLKTFVKKGLLSQNKDNFDIEHSVDALYLCKYLCQKVYFDKMNYEEITIYYVKQYILSMLEETNPRSFENNFKNLILNREKFIFLSKALTNVENEELIIRIIEKLNPGFILVFFNTFGDDNGEQKYKFFLKNKSIFKKHILNSLNLYERLPKIINKYYPGHDLLRDIIENETDFTNCLQQFPKSKDQKLILKSHPEYKYLAKEYHLVPKKEDYGDKKEQKKKYKNLYYFYSTGDSTNAKHINTGFIVRFYRNDNNEDISQIISNLLITDFYFNNLGWKQLGVFTSKIREHYKINNQICVSLAEKIVEKILCQKKYFEYSTDEELSLFLWHIESIKKSLCGEVIKDKGVIADMEKRIRRFSYTDAELYLLSHFAFEEWCILAIERLIKIANNSQELRLIKWYQKVKLNNEIEVGSLPWYIKNRFNLE